MGERGRIIVRPGGVGDTLLLAPALKELRDQGFSPITLAGYPSRIEPLLKAGLADRSVHVDDWLRSPLDVPNASSSRIDSFFASIPPELNRQPKLILHPPSPGSGCRIHAARYLARCLGVSLPDRPTSLLKVLLKSPSWPRSTRSAGVPPATRTSRSAGVSPAPFPSRCRRDASAPSNSGPAERRLWIHPGSGGREKRWPLTHFIKVAREARRVADIKPVFILGEAEEDLEGRITASGFEIRKPRDLMGLLNLFSTEDVYLGNDSGPIHLAALAGLATLAVYGPTDPEVWGPWGERVIVLTGDREGEWVKPEVVLQELGRSA